MLSTISTESPLMSAATATPSESTTASGSVSSTPIVPKIGIPHIIPLGTPVRSNPAISRVYEINKTAVDAGYWIDPSLESLFSYTFDQLTSIADFRVGRKNHGYIRYTSPIDLSTINNLSDILGNLIVFDNYSVCVYPESMPNKASPGHELNMPAVVTLENIFIYSPVGPGSKVRQRITDPSHPSAKRKTQLLKSSIESRGGEFITYDVATGVFVFKVTHFSTWGFTEDDLICDDDDENAFNGPNNTGNNDTFANLNLESSQFSASAEDAFAQKLAPGPRNGRFTLGEQALPGPSKPIFSLPEMTARTTHVTPLFKQPQDQNLSSTSSPQPSNLSELIHDDISMSENEFNLNELDQGSQEPPLMSRALIHIEDGQDPEQDSSSHNIQEDSQSPPKDWIARLSYASNFDSVLAPSPTSRDITDSGAELARGQTFNASDLDTVLFGGADTLRINSTVGQYIKASEELKLPRPFAPFSFAKFSSTSLLLKASDATPSSYSVEKLGFNEDTEIPPYYREILQNLISVSTGNALHRRSSSLPLFAAPENLSFHYITSQFTNLAPRVLEIFSLASILFDDVNLLGMDPIPEDGISPAASEKIVQQFRSNLLATWVSDAVANETAARVNSHSGDPLAQALAHLYGNQITKASVAASRGHNLHLATVIPLLGSPDLKIRKTASRQLQDWAEKRILGAVPHPVRVIYELLSGNTNVSKGVESFGSASSLCISKDLSWKQAFGLRLWYECTPFEAIPVSLLKYQDDFNLPENHVPAPYVDSQPKVAHVEYELISLFGSIDPDISRILDPRSSSNSPFDYKLPWLLHHVLVRALGIYSHNSSSQISLGDKLAIEFSSQLEAHGLLVEAIFVLCHIADDRKALSTVQSFIGRNIAKFSEHDLASLRRLGIPADIFAEARALYAHYSGDHWAETQYLLDANLWEEAHDCAIRTVSPEAVVSGNTERLADLLVRFVHPEIRIPSWSKGGQVYLDYIYLVDEINRLRRSRSTSTMPNLIHASFFEKDGTTKLPISAVSLRLLQGLAEINVPGPCDSLNGSGSTFSFETRVAVNIMASFVGRHLKSLGLGDNAALVLQMNVRDGSTQLQQTVGLSSVYFTKSVTLDS